MPLLRGSGTGSRHPRETYTYKGVNTVITAVKGDFCPACNEAILDRPQGDRYGELIGVFQRQVNLHCIGSI